MASANSDGWSGQDVDLNGLIATHAGDVQSPRPVSPPDDVQTGTGCASDKEDQRRRREFYETFTERALAKDGVKYKEEVTAIPESVEEEQVLAWQRWISLEHQVASAKARLICCPWSGGNSLAFSTWPRHLPGVEVLPLLLPGRLTRGLEETPSSITEVAAATVDALRGLRLLDRDIPLFVFGHELGALVVYEVCRRLHDEFPIAGLFVSGMGCPQMSHDRLRISSVCQTSETGEILHGKNAEFESAMLEKVPLPPEVRENKDLLQLFIPLWYEDLRAVDSYEYQSGPKLSCPIHSFGGSEDSETTRTIELWALESTSEDSTSTLYPGPARFFPRDSVNETQMLKFILGRCSMKHD